MSPERIRAAIRLLYPDHMTPTARNVLENILDDEEHEAPVSAGASLCPKEDDVSEHERITRTIHDSLSPLLTDALGVEHGWDAAEGAADALMQSSGARVAWAVRSPREQWSFIGRQVHWGHTFLVWTLTGNPSARNEMGKRFVRWVK